MKKIFILLSFSFCLFSFLQAQNPYVELSYPWLNLQQVKESKIKSIMLATMSADNSTVEKQVVLSFNQNGQLVKEECQVGFKYSAAFSYDNSGHLSSAVFSDENSSDTINYLYFPAESKYIRQTAEKTTSGTWDISETSFSYNQSGLLMSVEDFQGIVPSREKPGENSLGRTSETYVNRSEKETTLKSMDVFQTLSYSSKGLLQSWKSENFTYNITETFEYSYDQTGRLVMIDWSQEGNSSKTFVTYDFYK